MNRNVIEMGARVPRSPHPLLRRIAAGLLALHGWRIEVRLPDTPKMIVLAGPHTSNWDGYFAILTMLVLELKLGLFVKHTALQGPLGNWLRSLGAIPIDRTAAGGMVTQTIEAFRSRDQLVIGIAPEGTRSRVDTWKRGFHLIATGANVPMVCAYMDYGRKTVGVGPIVMPSGDYARDLETIQTFYRTITPHTPANFSANG